MKFNKERLREIAWKPVEKYLPPNNNELLEVAILSKIFFYKQWKEYCFTQWEQGVIFNDGCLLDTIDFIKQLNDARNSR